MGFNNASHCASDGSLAGVVVAALIINVEVSIFSRPLKRFNIFGRFTVEDIQMAERKK